MTRRLDIKTDDSADNADTEIFQFKFATYVFILIDNFFLQTYYIYFSLFSTYEVILYYLFFLRGYRVF